MKYCDRSYRLVLGLLVTLLFAALCPPSALAQATREPLSRTEVIHLLQGGVAPDRVGALAKDYGITFQVTDDTESQLRQAGANDQLIGMLRALAPKAAAAQPAPTSPPAAEPTAKPADATAPKKLMLKEGTEVKLKFAQDLTSKTATEGDPVNFTLDQDVRVGDVAVARSGAVAVGEVSHAEKAGHMGKAGALSVRLNYLKVGDNRVRLRGTKGKEGEGKTGTAVTLTVLFGPLGLLKHGKQVEVKEGSPLTAYVDQDIELLAAP